MEYGQHASQELQTLRPDGELAEPMSDAHEPPQVSKAEVDLTKSVLRKLDFILLPFLAILFLFNSLDRSNIGNAESANFTTDVGLDPHDLNTSVAFFFAFFVALQPVGAALGRRYGMAIWVPACMSLWGLCTALHIWVRAKWQLILLRIVIGSLEAGFYPVTVSYLSLFYTRYEFARRLALFYGQYAVAGALGGVLSFFVFEGFAGDEAESGGPSARDVRSGWHSWQILFLIEGCSTIVIALAGFLWLPHNAKTAWFLTRPEREWAEERVRRDLAATDPLHHREHDGAVVHEQHEAVRESTELTQDEEAERLLESEDYEAHDHPLPSASRRRQSHASIVSVTDDRGLSKADIYSAFTSWKIYVLLTCNILSSIPVTAFSVFLPLVLKPLAPSPSVANLLTAPPYILGAIVLYTFTAWSDRIHARLTPILASLALLLIGLTLVVVLPMSWAILRYAALCVLLSGIFIASPLTVAWIAGNTPSPGKRALLLGINGWGNLAGIFSALLFQPKYGPQYTTPFFVTLAMMILAFAGYAAFRALLVWENNERRRLLSTWDAQDVARERDMGRGPVMRSGPGFLVRLFDTPFGRARWLQPIRGWVEEAHATARQGDDRITFVFGL